MYLARVKKNGRTAYVIRRSYSDGGVIKSMDLFHMGNNPSDFITYVGGVGYYYADILLEALAAADVPTDQDRLDRIFFEFLAPNIQRVILGFDRSCREPHSKTIVDDQPAALLHLFDKRRYHYLRFGPSSQRHIQQVPDPVFNCLHARSRDELEQFFSAEEGRLKNHEKARYTATIFELQGFVPNFASAASFLEQMDVRFLTQLCRLDGDEAFWAGAPPEASLHDELVRYAIYYFDFEPPRPSPRHAYGEDFIRRHRVYRAPRKVRIHMEEAGRLFGLSWNTLKQLEKPILTRLYRRQAMQHHPDQGGDPEQFRRLAHYYQVLLKQ